MKDVTLILGHHLPRGDQPGKPALREAAGRLTRIAEIEPLIRAASAKAEIERRLPDHVAEALRAAGCYHLFRPRACGGVGLDPVSAFRVLEELARIDSAADVVRGHQAFADKECAHA